MIISRLLIRRFGNRSNGLRVHDDLLRRGFKSKNILSHRKANSIPFLVGVEKVMLLMIPIGLFFVYYDTDYPESFIFNTFNFDQLEDVVDEDGSKGIKKKRRLFQYDVGDPDTHSV